jgi:hypothetical protein
MQNEQITEHLGFAPITFVDGAINKVNMVLAESLDNLQLMLLEKYTQDITQV